MKSLNYFLSELDRELHKKFDDVTDWKSKSIVHERLKTVRGAVPGTLDIIDTEDDQTNTPSTNKYDWKEFAQFLIDQKITVGNQQVTAKMLVANAIKMVMNPDGSNFEAISKEINNLKVTSDVINGIKMEVKNGDIPAKVFKTMVLNMLKSRPAAAPPAPKPPAPKPPAGLYDVRTGAATATAPVQRTLTKTR